MNEVPLSAAHRRSAFAVCDPAYSAAEPYPPLAPEPQWLYPRSEYECFLLRKMRDEVSRAGLNVGYPGVFHEPVATVRFRAEIPAGELRLRVSGIAEAELDGVPLPLPSPGPDGFRRVSTGAGTLLVTVTSPDIRAALPALCSPGIAWEAAIDGDDFAPAVPGGIPEGTELPAVSVPLTVLGPGKWDAGTEVLAYVELHAPEKPDFGCGESLPELENRDPAHFEQSLALVETAPNVWRTPTPLAFRYLRSGNAEQVSCRALFEPAVYRGAFAADPELTEIWMHAAYTLRLCRHHFLIDGVKRDRLPWVGDLALSLLANAYVFGDPTPVRRTLAVLGRAGIREQHLNGIVDYSLWFLICHDLYQRYWGDRDFLELQRRELVDHIEVLLEQSRSGIFLPSAGTWLFIDWVDCPKESALQVLFHWSLQAAERLAERLGEAALAGRCREHARQLKSRLFAEAFDSRRGLFFQTPGEPDSGFGRHANFFALLADLPSPEQRPAIAEALLGDGLPPVGTPYMAALEIWALHRSGASGRAVERLRRIWGGMLRQGASTFFEAWREGAGERERYSFYGRPYGLSLCHAWSAGPAALLPLIYADCEPAADGWEQYRAREVFPGREFQLTVPLPGNELFIESGPDGFRIGSRLPPPPRR